jgi:hypothetical protein
VRSPVVFRMQSQIRVDPRNGFGLEGLDCAGEDPRHSSPDLAVPVLPRAGPFLFGERHRTSHCDGAKKRPGSRVHDPSRKEVARFRKVLSI